MLTHKSVNLFQLNRDDIKVTVDAWFEGQVLVIEGYDIGKTVEAYWGDSDYEYSSRLPKESVEMLSKQFGIDPGDNNAMLQMLASRYNTNTCYSELQSLFEKLGIKYEGFSWR